MNDLVPVRLRPSAPRPAVRVGTAATTVLTGLPGPGGYRRLGLGPGEPEMVRTDLGGREPSPRLRSLLAFIHLSDLHITDAQSPARAEFLDRAGPLPAVDRGTTERAGTYRPQETLTDHVMEAAARAVRALPGGPATGAPFALAISTGDAADNGQLNEIERSIALLDGGRLVVPDSGDRARFEGVGTALASDPGYWHPDGTPPGQPDDRPRALFGYPIVPGLHDASRRPFRATGVGLPWLAVYGNHDALIAGTVPPIPSVAARAVGATKLWDLDAPADVAALVASAQSDPGLEGWIRLAGPRRPVTPDSARRHVGARGWIACHRAHPGEPLGHGFDAAAEAAERTHYALDVGPVRLVVLDTVNRAGGWQGSLDRAQLTWLEAELVAGHSRYRDAAGVECRTGARDRLFLLASHHPLECLVNDHDPTGLGRALAGEVRELLLRFPNVVCWVNGHTHVHAVTPIVAPRGRYHGGFWQVTTASLVDWPQQGRAIELAVDEASGDLVITTVPFDHNGLIDPRVGRLPEIETLAGWSRELSANSWHRRQVPAEPDGRGRAADRTLMLVVPAPFPLHAAGGRA